MTLSFESDLSDQQDAIGAAVDLFEGQMADDSCYYYNIGEQPASFIDGRGNRLNISRAGSFQSTESGRKKRNRKVWGMRGKAFLDRDRDRDGDGDHHRQSIKSN